MVTGGCTRFEFPDPQAAQKKTTKARRLFGISGWVASDDPPEPKAGRAGVSALAVMVRPGHKKPSRLDKRAGMEKNLGDMLRLATQKRRLKPKVQEIADDDILEVAALASGEHPVVSASVVPVSAPEKETPKKPLTRTSRSGIAAFPVYAHDEPTRPFPGKLGSWKLPPPPRLPMLRSSVSPSQPSQPSHPGYLNSDPSVPPVALPVSPSTSGTRKAAAGATQKVRAALSDATENTLLIVHGRPSVVWAAALLAIGTCFGAFLARPGRSESAASAQVQETTQESTAPQINMAVAPTRAPTVGEVAVPVVLTPASPQVVTVVVAPPKVVTAKTVAAPAKPVAKKTPEASSSAPRVASKDPAVADALAREQLKSALK